MIVVKRSRGATRGCQSSIVTGCQVLCQVKEPTGTGEADVPMLEPNVNRRSKRRKKSTYQVSAFAMASCVKAGSESMNTFRGIRAYSSRQNHEPPDKLIRGRPGRRTGARRPRSGHD